MQEHGKSTCAVCRGLAKSLGQAKGLTVYKEGEKSRAICSFCEELTSTTFRNRDVPIRGKPITVNILAGVCDTCDKVIAVPQQEVPKITAALSSFEKS